MTDFTKQREMIGIDPSGVEDPPKQGPARRRGGWVERFDRLLELGLVSRWVWYGPFSWSIGPAQALTAAELWLAAHPEYRVDVEKAFVGENRSTGHARLYVRISEVEG